MTKEHIFTANGLKFKLIYDVEKDSLALKSLEDATTEIVDMSTGSAVVRIVDTAKFKEGVIQDV